MKDLFKNFKTDTLAGLVVFLVAVPLCLGIASGSGVPLFSGIIAGIIGGIIIGILSNSALSVSGPAAGLITIVAMQMQVLGSLEIFLTAVVLAGCLQLLMGLIRAGSIANYIPSNVIKGMLTAIGISIILKQIPHAVGYDKDIEGDESFVQANGENTFSALSSMLDNLHFGAIIISLICIGIILLWEQPFMKRFKLIPSALVAIILSVVLNQIFISSNSGLGIGQEDLVNVPVSKDFQSFINLFTFPDFAQVFGNKDLFSKVLIAAITIALVASIETLLCIEATDKLDPLKRTTHTNRELLAQGTGNIVSGLLGGIPVTSVIVRSSANINAGGTSKLSTIIHGVLLLLCAALIPNILNMIPLSALAGVLIMTGYKLAKPSLFKEMWSKGKYQFIPFIVTIIAIIFTDLLKGVGIGMVVSIVALLYGNMKAAFFISRSIVKDTQAIKLELAQEVSFLNKASIKHTLEKISPNSKLIIDASKSVYIDYDVLEIIKEFNDIIAPQRNISLILIGFKDAYNIENTPMSVFNQNYHLGNT